MPYAFEECSLELSFMETYTHVFRSTPPPQNKEYLIWLDKVQNKRKEKWENLGNFDVIQLSRTDPRYKPTMLIASIFFWEGLTNMFHLPCGMLTLTFFDVAAITILRPTGETFTHTVEIVNEFVFDQFSFKNYITGHHNKTT